MSTIEITELLINPIQLLRESKTVSHKALLVASGLSPLLVLCKTTTQRIAILAALCEVFSGVPSRCCRTLKGSQSANGTAL